jgi:hypothetical protein
MERNKICTCCQRCEEHCLCDEYCSQYGDGSYDEQEDRVCPDCVVQGRPPGASGMG